MSADWRQMYQLAGQELLADTAATTESWLQAYIPAEDWPAVSTAIEHAMQAKSVFELQHRVFRADGSVGWVHSRAVPVLNARGELVEWLGTGSDITAHKQAEQGLQASRELLQATLDSSLDMVQVFEAVRDEQGAIVDFTWTLSNEAAKKSSGQVICQRLLTHSPGVVEDGVVDIYRRVVETGQPNQIELHYTGEHFDHWFLQSTVKLHDGVVVTHADITARKLAEQEVLRLRDEVARRAEDKYHTLFNSMNEGFAINQLLRDEDGRAVDVRFLERNPAFERQTGLDHARTVGQLASQLLPAFYEAWLAEVERAFQTGRPQRFEQYTPGLDRWYIFYITPLREADRFAVFYDDITARKQAEQTQRESEAHQAFLLRLSDALRPLADAREIQRAAMRVVGEQLGVDRAMYADISADGETVLVTDNYLSGRFPAFTGAFPLAAYGAIFDTLRQGEQLIVPDVDQQADLTETEKANYKVIGSTAFVTTPLIKGGRWVSNLVVHQDAPRRWTTAEITILQETAERTWAAVERARAETARRESDERLRILVENLPGAAAFVVDAALRYQVAEGDALHQAGFQPADLVGRTVRETMPFDLWPLYEGHYRTALAGQPFSAEHEVHGRTFLSRGGPLRDVAGRVTAVMAVSYNITERRQAEEALRASEERFRNLVESYAQAVWETDPNGQVVRDSPSWRAHTGQTEAEWLDYGWVNAIHPDNQAYAGRQWREAVAAGRDVNTEFRLKHAPGGYRWTNVRATPIRDAQGRVQKWAGMNIDIHDRKTAEEDRDRIEERLRLAIDAAELGTWDWNLATNEVRWNARHFTLFGLEPQPDPVTPEFFARCVHPDDRPDVLGHLQAAIAENHLFEAEFRVTTAQGELRWISGHGQPTTLGPDGRVQRLSGVMLDVTARKHTEQHLQALAAALERKVERRTQALHESRDLLQSVYDTTLIGMAILHAVRDEASGAIEDFTFRSANKELARMTGRPNLVDRRLTQELPGMGPSGVLALMVAAVETGQPRQAELFYPHDDLNRWLAVMFVKLDGGVVATILDITERKTTEQQLVRNLHLLEQAETVARLGSWDYDLATEQFYWSGGMYQLFGLPLGQPVTPPVYLDYVLDEDRAKLCLRQIRQTPQSLFRHCPGLVQQCQLPQRIGEIDVGGAEIGCQAEAVDQDAHCFDGLAHAQQRVGQIVANPGVMRRDHQALPEDDGRRFRHAPLQQGISLVKKRSGIGCRLGAFHASHPFEAPKPLLDGPLDRCADALGANAALWCARLRA